MICLLTVIFETPDVSLAIKVPLGAYRYKSVPRAESSPCQTKLKSIVPVRFIQRIYVKAPEALPPAL